MNAKQIGINQQMWRRAGVKAAAGSRSGVGCDLGDAGQGSR